MRILLLTTYFRPDVASTGVIMSTLAEQFVARGHEVTVLASVPHYDGNRVWPEFSRRWVYREESSGIRIFRLYTYVARDRANVAQRILSYGAFHLLSLLKGATLRNHDVILAPSPPLSNGVIADLLARMHRIPFVYNVQDIWPDVAVRAGVLTGERTIQRLRAMERHVYRRAARIAVVAEGFRNNLLEKGIPPEKISVIPNFIDTEFITPQPKANGFAAKHDLSDKFVVLFAGNMGFSQGLETVLEAAKLLQDQRGIQFLLVGNGAGRNAAEERSRLMGLRNVQFLPFQPHRDLPEMYGSAEVCLIPLRRGFTGESVPCKLFSIMAAGRPAVAAVDSGSETWSLVERTQVGLCVQPEDPAALAEAILHYRSHPEARLAAGRNARRCVETEFRPEPIADLYLDAMRAAIETAGGNGSPNSRAVHDRAVRDEDRRVRLEQEGK